MAGRRERKVVTVLFADLAGFTARAETMDPEDVAAFLDPYHRRLKGELERFGGTVEKFIGDAVMAIFGAPVAHEDDAERAVRAALAIRGWAADEEVELRIGINSGEALVTLDVQPAEGQALATGDVVNTAARLQAAAPTGGILVGAQTHRATERAIEYAESEPVAAKGKVEPVPAWLAIAPRSRVHVERTHGADLVGRHRELELLAGALDHARQERSPELVTLVGVPGIGKSRLVYELYRRIEAETEITSWRHGRCVPYGDGVTFWALSEMVKAQAGILEGDDEPVTARKLHAAVDDPWVESHLRPLVGIASDAGGGGDRRDEAFTAWRRFFERLADERPLVLVFEDLHWADDNLLDFVDHLVDWTSDVPLLVVCTARPELLARRPGWGGGKPNALTISLSPLSDDETARLLGGLLERSVLPAETQAELLAHAGGNPLYAEEYVRILRDRGEVGELPETVQGLIAARLDLLEPEQKALLQDAAVVGKTFWLGAVGGAAETLHALERREFVRRERQSTVAGETEYVFRHVLVRDVAYGQIPRADRADKHRHAAEWIEQLGRPEDHAEMLAHHYLQAFELGVAAGLGTDAFAGAAARALTEAGDRAFGLHAYDAAERYYRAALDLDKSSRGVLLLRLCRAMFALDESAVDVALEARDLFLAADDAAHAAEAEHSLAEHQWVRGERDLAWEHLDRARTLVAPLPPSPVKAMTTATASRLHMLANQNDEAVRIGTEAIAMAEALGLDAVRGAALNNVGTARAVRGDDGGMVDLAEAIEVAESANEPFEMLRAKGNLAVQLSIRGRLGEAIDLWREAAQDAQRFGQRAFGRWLAGVVAWPLYAAGRWDEALAGAQAFVAEVEAGAPHYLAPANYMIRGRIRLARDQLEPALVDVERALELAIRTVDPQNVLPMQALAAFTFYEQGDEGRAAELAESFLPMLASPGGPGFAVFVANVFSWTITALGRGAELADALEQYPQPWAHSARAFARGDVAKAAAICDEIGAAGEAAQCRLLGARLTGDGSGLAAAVAFYDSVGATRYVRECEALAPAQRSA